MKATMLIDKIADEIEKEFPGWPFGARVKFAKKLKQAAIQYHLGEITQLNRRIEELSGALKIGEKFEEELLRDMATVRADCQDHVDKIIKLAKCPIPLLLACPSCGERHIDAGEFAAKPHHTHACQHCGMTWRPAIVATVGVQFLPGFKDEVQP